LFAASEQVKATVVVGSGWVDAAMPAPRVSYNRCTGDKKDDDDRREEEVLLHFLVCMNFCAGE
jgi:hypothetical protein